MTLRENISDYMKSADPEERQAHLASAAALLARADDATLREFLQWLQNIETNDSCACLTGLLAGCIAEATPGNSPTRAIAAIADELAKRYGPSLPSEIFIDAAAAAPDAFSKLVQQFSPPTGFSQSFFKRALEAALDAEIAPKHIHNNDGTHFTPFTKTLSACTELGYQPSAQQTHRFLVILLHHEAFETAARTVEICSSDLRSTKKALSFALKKLSHAQHTLHLSGNLQHRTEFIKFAAERLLNEKRELQERLPSSGFFKRAAIHLNIKSIDALLSHKALEVPIRDYTSMRDELEPIMQKHELDTLLRATPANRDANDNGEPNPAKPCDPAGGKRASL